MIMVAHMVMKQPDTVGRASLPSRLRSLQGNVLEISKDLHFIGYQLYLVVLESLRFSVHANTTDLDVGFGGRTTG